MQQKKRQRVPEKKRRKEKKRKRRVQGYLQSKKWKGNNLRKQDKKRRGYLGNPASLMPHSQCARPHKAGKKKTIKE
jgi:hypothetical protein